MTVIEEFYENQPEPQRGCFLAMRNIILQFHTEIQETWKWGTPFFILRKKMFCYFWKDKKTGEPYIGFHKGMQIDHPHLEKGDRKTIKIFRLNPDEDLPVEALNEVLTMVLDLTI